MRGGRHVASDRGAVLVHVAIALVGLMALSAFVIDYGVLWVSRRQAQNAADAGAMAGAIHMGYVDMDDQAGARQAAIDAVLQNWVWGQAPDIDPGDVTFPPCPPGSPGAGTNACIRVDVFRNQDRANPLPTFFATLAGVNEQGVQATATAEVLFGEETDCVKPWAIPDKWIENYDDQAPPGWSEDDAYQRVIHGGPNSGQLYQPPDYYEPQGTGPMYAPNGTGFTRDSVTLGGSDYGRRIVLKFGNPHDQPSPGWFQPVVLDPGCRGGHCYELSIASCSPAVIGPGTVLDVEPGGMIGPTRHGMEDLIAQDQGASWNTSLNGGRGGIQGGCMAAATCSISPRLVAIPVYDPQLWDEVDPNGPSGRTQLTIRKVLGFFIDRMQGNDVVGYIMAYPSQPRGGTSTIPESAFVISISLVR